MSGHRWHSAPIFICFSCVVLGCQSDGTSQARWNPFARSQTEQTASRSDDRMSLPKFGRRKPESEVAEESAVPLLAESRVESLLNQGQAALQEERLEDARKAYEEILAADPDNATAHHGIAMAADLSEQWADAEYHYKQALRIRPRDANLLCDIGYSYLLQNRYAESARYLNQAIEVSPQHESAQMNLALLDLKQGNRAAAEQRLQQRFSSPGTVEQVLSQLESRLATASNPGHQDSGPSGNSGPTSFEEVRALAARERELSEQQRALRTAQRPEFGMTEPPISGSANMAGESSGNAELANSGPIVAPALNQSSQATGATPGAFGPPAGSLYGMPPGAPIAVSPAAMAAAPAGQPGESHHGAQTGTNSSMASTGNWSPGGVQTGRAAPGLPAYGAGLPMVQPMAAPPAAQYPTAAAAPAGVIPVSGGVTSVRSSGAFRNETPAGGNNGMPAAAGPATGSPPVSFTGMTGSSTAPPQFGSSSGSFQAPAAIPGTFGTAGPSSGLPTPGYSAPVQLEGLNAGPGALFPINSGANINGATSPTAAMPAPGGWPQSGVTPYGGSQAGFPEQTGIRMNTVSSPGTNSMINGAMYPAPARSFSSADWAMQQQNGQVTAPASAIQPGAWPASQQSVANPLESYDAERRKLDMQYDNMQQSAIRQPPAGQSAAAPQIPAAQYPR